MLATSSAPLTISGYIWFDISGTNIPTVLVLCVFKLLATILGLYPNFFIASKTFFLVSSFTTSMSFNTLETKKKVLEAIKKLGYRPNIVAIILMYIDKQKAKKHQWRISEDTLIGVSIIGGGIGALWGMHVFLHKTKHAKFTIWFSN